MNVKLPGLTAVALALLFCAGAAPAADDHNHDQPAGSVGPAAPRFAAVSESFELVGVLHGKQLTLYLDRFADNTPVTDAHLSVEIDGVQLKLAPHGAGEFEAELAQAPKPGVLPVAAIVVAGAETDLLAGELDIHSATPMEATSTRARWQRIALWTLAGLLVLGAVLWAARRRTSQRRATVGGAA